MTLSKVASSLYLVSGASFSDVLLGTQVALAGPHSQSQVCLRAGGYDGVKRWLSANHRAVGKHVGYGV